jgi:hypothetical protein
MKLEHRLATLVGLAVGLAGVALVPGAAAGAPRRRRPAAISSAPTRSSCAGAGADRRSGACREQLHA